MNTYEITTGRAALALLVGALTGSLLVSAWYLAMFVMASSGQLPGDIFLYQFRTMLILVPMSSFLVFAGGLLIIGIPLWALLHQLGWRSWMHSIIFGFLAGVVAALAIQFVPRLLLASGTIAGNYRERELDWLNIAGSIAWIGVACAIVGLVIWRIAYRRVEPIAG